MKNLFLILTTALLVASCSNKVKNKLGFTTTGPDEYQVQKFKSLETPPHYQLVAPK